jgi:hypothetical protein
MGELGQVNNRVRWVKLTKYCELTGDTPDGVYAKNRRKIWKLDQHYRKAPDGCLWINLDAVDAWIQTERFRSHGD